MKRKKTVLNEHLYKKSIDDYIKSSKSFLIKKIIKRLV